MSQPPGPLDATARLLASQRRDRLAHLALIGLTLLLVWTSIYAHLRETAAQARREAANNTANFARAFEQNIVRTFDAIDQTLLFVRELYARDPAGFDLTTWARNRQFLHGVTFQISVVDRDGFVVASNLGAITGRIDVSNRDPVRAQRESTDDRIYISPPQIGRISHRMSLDVSRKLFDAAGRYAGVVLVSVDPYQLTAFGDTLDLGNGLVLLVGDDRVIRARAPPTPGALGLRLDDAAAAHLFSGPRAGTFESPSPIDDVTRLVSYRRVGDYPLTVAVGLDMAEVYAPYERERWRYLLAGLFVSLFVVSVGVLLIRQRRGLVASQSALSATLDSIGQGIVMQDGDGRVPVVNRRAAELLGLPEALTRMPLTFADLLRWQIRGGEFAGPDAIDPSVRREIESGAVDHLPAVYQRVRPNGTVLEVSNHKMPDGGLVRTYTDITERRATERALAAARDAAEAAVRARSEFLAVMSHEIRTPMNGILGVAGLLMDMDMGEMERAYVRIILDSGNHLLQLINDILDFSRLDAGRLELEDGAFDLPETVRATVGLLASQAQAKGLRLECEIAPDVPRRVGGDARRLRQVLLNLLGNAIKFTERGHVRLAVTRLEDVAAEADGPARTLRVGFAVSDTGIGIPAEALGRLFTEFTQVDSSISRRFGGSGLGLAISRRLVTLMGGEITAASVAGQGSVFRFDIRLALRDDAGEEPAPSLPIPALPIPVLPTPVLPVQASAAPAPADPHALLPDAPPEPAAAAPDRLHVLVAEDNATNRLVATRMLERLGHSVDAVEDGRAAVAAVAARPYDLVLMDVMMPEMDGLAATARIRALPGAAARTPILGLTANARRADEVAALAAGMDYFATKPISAARLQQALGEAVARARAAPPPQAPAAADDEAALGVLALGIGREPAAELVRLFIETAPRHMAAIQALAARGETLDMARQARTLASAARAMGLLRIARACGDLEALLAAAPTAPPPPLDKLAGLLDEGTARLRQWLAEAA